MLFLTGNQLSSTSHSVLVTMIHLVCFSFQHLKAGSERWPWIRQGPRREWGLLLHKLHTWADAGCQQRLSCGRCLWEDCVSVLMEYLWQTVLWCFLESSHRSFLGARWENSTVWWENSTEMRLPRHELLKLRETVQKSQHELAHGKKESPGGSP